MMDTRKQAAQAALEHDVRSLAIERQQHGDVLAHLKRERERFEDEIRELKANEEALRHRVAEREQEVRASAARFFVEFGEKRPVRGVEVKRRTRLEYDDDRAIQWAMQQGLANALTLRKREFEKVASVMAPGCVRMVEEPFATISRNLGTRLADAEPEVVHD